MEDKENECGKCAYNAKLLHKDMPFGCFGAQGWDECWLERHNDDDSYCKRVQNNWIKNHPNWKGIPHMKYWFYAESPEEFEEFLKMYPDKEHAPNESWIDMYDEIILK